MSTTSWANRSASAGSSIAWPPYLMTTVVPRELLDVRQRLGEDCSLHHCFARYGRGYPGRGRSLRVLGHDVPMFSSTYAWVRSVNVTVASPVPACRSQSIAISRREHQLRQGSFVVGRGDAVATDRARPGRQPRRVRDRSARRWPRARRARDPSRGRCRTASTARVGCARPRGLRCAPRPPTARRVRRWSRAWSHPRRRPPSGAPDRHTRPRARRRTPRTRGSSG